MDYNTPYTSKDKSMTAPKHSPLPWSHAHAYDGVKDANGKAVMLLRNLNDARLIVTAVNSHAELLAAANSAVREFDSIMEIGTDGDDCIHVRNALQAAIAKAEERAP